MHGVSDFDCEGSMVEKRGRKTAADLSLAVIPGGGRPEPPDGMPEDEAEVWQTIVGAMPPGWFGPQNRDLLKRYCHVVCGAEATAQRVRRISAARMTDENLRTWSRLSSIGLRETTAMCSLATKLRLTPQGSVRKCAAEAEIRNAPRPRPWED